MDEAFLDRHQLIRLPEGELVRAGCSCGAHAQRAHRDWSPRHNQGWHRVHVALAYALGPNSGASVSLREMTCRPCQAPVLGPTPAGEALCPHGQVMIAAMNAVGVGAFGWRPDQGRPFALDRPRVVSGATFRWAQSALAADIHALYDPQSDLTADEVKGAHAALVEVAGDLGVDLAKVVTQEATPEEVARMRALLDG